MNNEKTLKDIQEEIAHMKVSRSSVANHVKLIKERKPTMKRTYGKQLTHIYCTIDDKEEKVLNIDDLILTEYDLGDGEYRYTLSYRGDEMLTEEQVHDYLHGLYDELSEIYGAIED